MIQIVAGTFGYFNGRKIVPITEADGPQKLDPALEARLVKKGIAKYVGAPVVTQEPVQQDPEPAAGIDEQQSENKPSLPEYNEDMKLDELKEIAKAYGVNASAMRKKADVIAAIEASQQEDDDADDEAPPQLDAADPV